MSLDVYLEIDTPVWRPSETIPVRANGSTVELTREQWDHLYPDREPVVLLNEGDCFQVFTRNITHNLGPMALEAGIYDACWQPEEMAVTHARELIAPLSTGLDALRSEPERFKRLNPDNGWGDYEGLVDFVNAYLSACRLYPGAKVRVSR